MAYNITCDRCGSKMPADVNLAVDVVKNQMLVACSECLEREAEVKQICASLVSEAKDKVGEIVSEYQAKVRETFVNKYGV